MSQSAVEKMPDLFVGEFDHVLDAQGRVSLPSDWRSRDGETELMMIPTRDKALLLLPVATFFEFIGKVGKMAIANPGMQRALAYLGSQSRRCRCDKQGRMALDRAKLEEAGIKDELKLAGAVTHIRITAPGGLNVPQDDNSIGRYFDAIRRAKETPAAALSGLFGFSSKSEETK